MKLNVYFVLQRHIGTARMRIWALSPSRPGLGWFYDQDFTQSLREQMQAHPVGAPRPWGGFEQNFFGPEFELLPALNGLMEESTLDRDFKCRTAPDIGSLRQQLFAQTPAA